MNLDRVITLQQPTSSRNNSGQYVLAYATARTAYAALNPTTAKEDNSGAQLYGQQVVRWAIRYATDVQHNWRVVHEYDGITDTYEIVGIMHNARRTYTTLIARLREYEQ